MEKLQLVFNLDKSLCIDLYSRSIFTADFPRQLSNYCDQVAQATEKKIREYPFRIGKCSCCGHPLASNRDRYTEFKCQNCGETAVLQVMDTVETQHILRTFCEIRGIKTTPLEGQYADILVVLPNDFSHSTLLHQIFQAFGFTPMKKEGQNYAFLVSVGLFHGRINESHNLAAYARAELTAEDEIYGDLIPRVEELDRYIRKCFPDAFTISQHVPIAESTSNDWTSQEMEDRIRQLVEEGKMEEALALSRKLK